MVYKDDQYYLKKIRKGEVSLYAKLIDKYKDLAFNLAFKIIRNNEDAEEVAQDAFLKAFQSIDSLKEDTKFSTWVYKIIYNAAISKVRRKQYITSSFDDEPSMINIENTFNAINELDNQDQKKYINLALDKLPENEKAIVTLFYLNELPVNEIGEIMNLSVSNVKVKLHRARKKLHSILSATINDLMV